MHGSWGGVRMISEDVDYSIRIIRAIFNNGEDNPIDAKMILKMKKYQH